MRDLNALLQPELSSMIHIWIMSAFTLTAVVCDDKPARESAVVQLLARAGGLVVQTTLPSELKRIVADTKPTIIAIDLALAGMGGLELVRELHVLCADCVIVVLSPFTGLRQAALDAGAWELIDINDLRALESLLAGLSLAHRGDRTIDLDEAATPAEQPRT